MAVVLFVCARNVCRSPLLASAFRATAVSLGWQVDVVSAGTMARSGQRACVVSASVADPDGDPTRSLVDHRSRTLDEVDPRAPDLVFAADRATRAALARHEPSLRSRSFTVREALALASAPPTDQERAEATHAGGRRSRYAVLAPLLHRRRGSVVAFDATISRRRGEAFDAWDIDDVHRGSDRAHRRGLVDARADAEALATVLQQIAAQGSLR